MGGLGEQEVGWASAGDGESGSGSSHSGCSVFLLDVVVDVARDVAISSSSFLSLSSLSSSSSSSSFAIPLLFPFGTSFFFCPFPTRRKTFLQKLKTNLLTLVFAQRQPRPGVTYHEQRMARPRGAIMTGMLLFSRRCATPLRETAPAERMGLGLGVV